ncbi:MAG: DUF3347 domain-containing protein [Chitinophagales bacterium]
METIKLILLMICIALLNGSSYAKIKNSKTASYKVYGNCGMCKKTIESTVKQNKDALGIWNSKSQMLTVTYDSTKTSADEILKRIANVGYDNEKYLSSNEVYNSLDACCQYNRKIVSKTSVTVPSAQTSAIENKDEMPMAAEIKDTAKVVTTPMEMPVTPKTETVVAKTDFTLLLTQYYALKNALIADNSGLAIKNAVSLLAEINAVKMETLSASEHTVWMKYYDKLKADATQISTAKNIEKQRTAFSSLSSNLWSTVKGLKIKDNGVIYVDYCPMKDAYWLSKDSAIKNPYYGKSMLTCGSIKETIK